MSENTLKSLKKKGESEDDTFMDKMLIRIIDNVQLTIKNIHVRLEDQLDPNNRFSLGLCLEEFQLFTTNADWHKQFIDRTQPQHKHEPMRKQLILNNLGIYWNENPSDLSFLAFSQNHEKNKSMMQVTYPVR